MKKFFVLFLFGTFPLFTGCANGIPSSEDSVDTSASSSQEETQITPSQESFVFPETEFDFGIIKQSGGKVQHDFEFTYTGTEPLVITGIPTSCACTSATVNKTNIQPGDTGVVTVIFNPNLHAEPEGKFFKTVALLTEPKLPKTPEVKIWTEIDLDLGPKAFELKSDHDEEDESEEEGLISYTSVTPEKFSEMLKNKDFTLVDVHIPEQDHIPGTDLVTPYNEIEENIGLFPQDKNAKIVVYCRSGPMSRAAAYTLAEHGYTNIYDLSGGKNAYDAYGEFSTAQNDVGASATVEYIEFDAVLVTEANYEELSEQAGGSLPIGAKNPEKTSVLLVMDNHRENLGAYDYQKQVTLDGVPPESWQELLNGMGGHHITGLLTFPKTLSPSVLTIADMSVGEVTLRFSPTKT